MMSETETTAVLTELADAMPGFIAAAVVDLDSGMTLGMYSRNDSFDLSAASAYNSEIVKQKQKVMVALDLKSELEDMLMTLSDQIHLIRLISPASFVYVAADRSSANLAIVRAATAKHAALLGN